MVDVSWANDASRKEVLKEALNARLSVAWYLNDILELMELSVSRSSYLNAPFTSKLSDGFIDPSTKTAIAFLLALLSRPPPKNSKSAGTVIFPDASN